VTGLALLGTAPAADAERVDADASATVFLAAGGRERAEGAA
jgi:hypothetical protein